MPTLTWNGKDEAILIAQSVPFRLLEDHETLPGGSFGGRVKCIYIDPPYNAAGRDAEAQIKAAIAG
jgi:hypothetical protein